MRAKSFNLSVLAFCTSNFSVFLVGVMSGEVQEYVSSTLRACGSMLGAGMEHQ